MSDLYVLGYSVRGIKTLDEWAELSFFKKTITKEFNIRSYNVKGIYGANGSGKSAIVASVKILKNIVLDSSYLNNRFAQRELQELINKRLGSLEIKTQYLVRTRKDLWVYEYYIKLEKSKLDRIYLSKESLSKKRATTHGENYEEIFCVDNGALVTKEDNSFSKDLIDNTKNLLTTTSTVAAWIENPLTVRSFSQSHELGIGLLSLLLFGYSLHVYMDTKDDHTDYYWYSIIENLDNVDGFQDISEITQAAGEIKKSSAYAISSGRIIIAKKEFPRLEKEVKKLYDFLHIFKYDLQGIRLDKKEDENNYICDLVMQYPSYSVNSEFESTGIKKLIDLFEYFKRAVSGGIVFIDEMDSNLHDVYLCALLEYLMEYGNGQLCFTTHNIGPMDVLKRNKKSIDFLSVDHKIYSWTNSGNYSPSKLYRNGMIEGSPFNVDSIDFIGVFHTEEDEKA